MKALPNQRSVPALPSLMVNIAKNQQVNVGDTRE